MTDVEEFPVFEFTDPPLFPELLFPPVDEFEFMLKLMLELLVWFTVQFWLLVTFTVLLEPEPLPSIMITVPDPEGFGVGDEVGLSEGVGEGFGVWEGFGVVDGPGVSEGFGDADGDGVTEGDGLGKLAAAVKELARLPALLVNKPKTDWFRANRIKVIKNDERK